MRQLGLTRPIVAGSSGGARITLELARTRPDLLAAAVMSEPPIFSLASAQPKGPSIGELVQQAAATGGPTAAVDAFFPILCPGLWSQLDDAGKDRYRANGPMMLEKFTGPTYAPSIADIRGIHVPCLMISGTTSLMISGTTSLPACRR